MNNAFFRGDMIRNLMSVDLVFGKIVPKRITKKNKKSELKKAEDKIQDIYDNLKRKGEEEKHG